MKFEQTTAMKRIFAMRGRIRAVAGGTSASKTISILVWLIDYAQTHRNKLIWVVSESIPHLKNGAMDDFKKILIAHNYFDNKRWNASDYVYTFETGSRIKFTSVDTYGKAHGARRDVLFINECNYLPYNIVDQLITRTREVIWLDWNPTTEFWFYTEMEGKRNDIEFITLTYKDNEALEESVVAEIESHKNNPNWWRVYGLGQLGEAEGKVYTGWKIIDTIPFEAQLLGYGLDFGYTNDPTAIVAVYKFNGGYVLDEITYRKGLSNRQIADILQNQEYGLVVADSSEPKSIDEIASYGVSIVGATKGQGSINKGIAFVQDQKISVTKRSLNIIKEYRNYMFITDRNGKVTNIPADEFNHAMDAIRYRLNERGAQKTIPSSYRNGNSRRVF